MGLFRRWATALSVATLLALATAAPALAAAPSEVVDAAAPTDTAALNNQNLNALSSCLVANKKGDVLILLDKSGSINTSDPDGFRLDAAKALLSRLASRVSDSNSELYQADLTAAVTTFGERVYQNGQVVEPAALQWSDLNASTVGDLNNQVEKLRPVSQNDGLETDYWYTLDWAAKAEEAHAQAQNQPVADGCHLVFFFSDGKPLLAKRGDGQGSPPQNKPWPDGTQVPTPDGLVDASTQAQADAAQVAQLDDMERAGGVSDRLRLDRLVLVGVGLGSAKDLATMQCLAVNNTPPIDGRPGQENATCGALPAIGAFFGVTDAGLLILYVEGLGDTATALDPVTKQLCPGQACSDQAYTFRLDPIIRTAHVVGVASVSGSKVQISAPDGSTGTIAAAAAGSTASKGTTTVGTLKVSYEWVTDRELTLDLVRPGTATKWAGNWGLTFIGTGSDPKAHANIRVWLSADLALNAVNPQPSVHAEEALKFGVQLTSPSGGAADLGASDAFLSGSTLTGTVTLIPSAAGAKPIQIAQQPVAQLRTSGINWTVPSDVTLGPAKVELSLAITSDQGRTLNPVVRQFDLVVQPALGAPTVTSTELDFGTVQGTDTGTSTLNVSGPGCVWVTGGALLTHPAAVDSITVGGPASSAGSCVTVADGASAQLTVSATPTAPANGAVQGQVTVHLAKQGHTDSAATQLVPYRMELERKPAGIKWVIFAAALLIGIGLPILVLWLTRRIAARYPVDVQLSAARIPVMVGPRGLLTHGGATPTVPQQWNSVPPPVEGRRGLLVEGVKLRARSGPLWSARAGYSEAVDRPGSAAVAPFYGGPNFLARLPLGVQGSWSLLFRSRDDLAGPAEQIPGDLLLILHPSTDEAARRNLLGEAISQGPGLVNDLREAVRAKLGAAGPASDGGPGGGPGGPGPGGAGGGPGGGGPNGGPGGPAVRPGPWPTGPGGGSGQPWGQAAPAPPASAPGWGQPAGPPPPQSPGWAGGSPPAQAPGWGQAPSGPRPDAPPPTGWPGR